MPPGVLGDPPRLSGARSTVTTPYARTKQGQQSGKKADKQIVRAVLNNDSAVIRTKKKKFGVVILRVSFLVEHWQEYGTSGTRHRKKRQKEGTTHKTFLGLQREKTATDRQPMGKCSIGYTKQ